MRSKDRHTGPTRRPLLLRIIGPMLYSWWLLDGLLLPCTAWVPPPAGARLIGFSVLHSMAEDLLAASICGAQAAALDQN